MGFIMLIFAVVIAFIFLMNIKSVGKAPDENSIQSTHYKGGVFVNDIPTQMSFSLSQYYEMVKLFIKKDSKLSKPKNNIPVDDSIWVKSEFWWSWLGHASVMIHLENKNYLIDPVFSERSSMVQWAGPKRFHKVPKQIEAVEQFDAVIISHDHYDHLDYETIVSLAHKTKRFLVPLGVGSHLRYWGIEESKIVELDWWEEYNDGTTKIIATPARHFSGRGLTDKFKTFWSSWSIISESKKIFYSGDSGFFEGYKEIGEKLGPFDLNFMQVGAYNKLWSDIHMFPEEVADAHLLLNAKQLVPLHWATFDLALHSWDDPVERLVNSSKENDIDLIVPIVGKQITDSTQVKSYWWR